MKNRYTVSIICNGQDESRIVEADDFSHGEDGIIRFTTRIREYDTDSTKLVFAVPAANVAGIEPRS